MTKKKPQRPSEIDTDNDFRPIDAKREAELIAMMPARIREQVIAAQAEKAGKPAD